MNTAQNEGGRAPQMEGARRATGICGAGETTGVIPNPEVSEQKPRRRYTAKYKVRILRESEACAPGKIGAFLRREGLYWSTLAKWRKQRDDGILGGLSPLKRGRKHDPDTSLRKTLAAKEREIERLQKRLKQAEIIIDVQKKVSEMLGVSLGTEESNGKNA